MEFNDVIETRRSVRKYNPLKKVAIATVEELIQAASIAPSWKNSQTARYYCILSDSVLERFKNECLPAFNAKNVKDAPLLIVTTFLKNHSGFEKNGEPTNELGDGWGFYDLGLQSENLLLKAKELGLDTLVMGIRDADKIRELLSIEQEEIIVSVIGVGYRDAEPLMPKRKEVQEITKFY